MDFKDYTDEQLDQVRIDVLTEQEHRANMAAIPGQIASLAAAYTAGGGDKADLLSAIDDE